MSGHEPSGSVGAGVAAGVILVAFGWAAMFVHWVMGVALLASPLVGGLALLVAPAWRRFASGMLIAVAVSMLASAACVVVVASSIG